MSSQEAPILSVEKVTKIYETKGQPPVYACDEVSFTVKKGQTLGIVGESGCGKSTLAQMLLHLLPPTSGNIFYRGIDYATLKGEPLRQVRREIQAVFQDAMGSFHPRMKVKEIICAPLLNYGLMKRKEMEERARRLLEQVELPGEYANLYPFSLSGGERQRVAIARAIALNPQMIVCDEATSALDVTIQSKIVEMLRKLQREMGVTILFISHDLVLVENICHKILVMYCGHVVEIIEGRPLHAHAKHPYTRALVDAVFSLDMDFNQPLALIDGEPANHLGKMEGCPFHSRCQQGLEICRVKKPTLQWVGEGHFCACHLSENLGDLA